MVIDSNTSTLMLRFKSNAFEFIMLQIVSGITKTNASILSLIKPGNKKVLWCKVKVNNNKEIMDLLV